MILFAGNEDIEFEIGGSYTVTQGANSFRPAFVRSALVLSDTTSFLAANFTPSTRFWMTVRVRATGTLRAADLIRFVEAGSVRLSVASTGDSGLSLVAGGSALKTSPTGVLNGLTKLDVLVDYAGKVQVYAAGTLVIDYAGPVTGASIDRAVLMNVGTSTAFSEVIVSTSTTRTANLFSLIPQTLNGGWQGTVANATTLKHDPTQFISGSSADAVANLGLVFAGSSSMDALANTVPAASIVQVAMNNDVFATTNFLKPPTPGNMLVLFAGTYINYYSFYSEWNILKWNTAGGADSPAVAWRMVTSGDTSSNIRCYGSPRAEGSVALFEISGVTAADIDSFDVLLETPSPTATMTVTPTTASTLVIGCVVPSGSVSPPYYPQTMTNGASVIQTMAGYGDKDSVDSGRTPAAFKADLAVTTPTTISATYAAGLPNRINMSYLAFKVQPPKKSAPIQTLQITQVAATDGAGTDVALFGLSSGTNSQYGPEILLTQTPQTYVTRYDNNPFNGQPWSNATLNSLNISIKVSGAGYLLDDDGNVLVADDGTPIFIG